jgi:hypothetical protein
MAPVCAINVEEVSARQLAREFPMAELEVEHWPVG